MICEERRRLIYETRQVIDRSRRLIDEAQLLSDNPLTGMSCANRARIAGERDSLGRLS